ncbi:hypothetical protein AB0N16_26135 [Streptomyces sp. NPDC051105]|uniref:hypothetical protein n=1 Tax=Streptomyces sp. NPDC051105 TaxID=3154843 RepID=UPI003422AC62
MAARATYGPHVPSAEGEKTTSVSVREAVLVAATVLIPADVTMALARFLEIVYP